MKTVGNLKDSVSGILTGTNLNNVTGLNQALERAARNLLQNADIPEATEREALTLYNGVYDYTAPTKIFGSALVDLRPQGVARELDDGTYKKPIILFDRTKTITPSGYNVAFEWRQGVGRMRVSSSKPQSKIVLDMMNVTTGWTASGNASGLAQDKTNFYQSNASLRFNLAASGSQGILTKTLDTAKDLTDYEGVGVVFLAIRTPSASALTSIRLRLGSDSSNYFQVTDTDGFLGAWVANDWLLVALDLSGATETGTVDIDSGDYAQLAFNYDGTAMTNFRVGGLFVSLPSPSELIYQTAAIFKASGAILQTITNDADEIVLSDPAYLIYEYESALEIHLQNGGELNKGRGLTLFARLKELYQKYQGDNPSQQLREIGRYTSGPRFSGRFRSGGR